MTITAEKLSAGQHAVCEGDLCVAVLHKDKYAERLAKLFAAAPEMQRVLDEARQALEHALSAIAPEHMTAATTVCLKYAAENAALLLKTLPPIPPETA